ncbi:MAG: hypothetical protein H6737_22465 [Alphaproteobacteria bacterium]|nr:hypothetical protein [Alphaproteobacteria bacterium]
MPDPRKLSPALLAALGLTACTDGCHPSDLPLVGTLFDDGGDDRVGPCLEMMPCLSPPPIDTDAGPCLNVPEPEPPGLCLIARPAVPITQPIRVGPCLKIRRPEPIPEPPVAPCLKPVAPPRPSVKPCLDFVVPPQAPLPTPAPDDQSGLVLPDRVEVLATLLDSGILPPDVLDRIDRRSG